MKHAQNVRQSSIGSVLKFMGAAILMLTLSACGGGGSGQSSTKKVPDAYRTSTPSDQTTKLKGTGNTKGVQTGKIQLSWSAPATRTDGQPLALSEIDGYRVYYGTKKGVYIKGADVRDGTAESVTITDVPFGDYYVVMTTYDANGIESDYSAAVKKVVS